MEHQYAVAQVADLVGGVADQDDRAALCLELGDLVHALALERLVADGEDLVDQQEVGVDVHGDGEGEPHVHARTVELDLGVDERLDARELDDLVEVPVGVRAGQPEDGGVEVHVLATGQVLVEAGAELQEGRHAAAPRDRCRSLGWRMPPIILRSVLLPEPL